MKAQLLYLLILGVGLAFTPNVLSAPKKASLQGQFSGLAVFQDAKPRKYHGYLLELQDSSLLFSSKKEVKLPYEPALMDQLYVADIQRLKFSNQKTQTVSVLIGIVAGGFVGYAARPRLEKSNAGGVISLIG